MDPAQVLEAKVLKYQDAMNSVIDRFESPVQQFYCGAAVLVTGGSGFLGKQLIEKLFRSTKISKVFMLIRPKKGKSIEKRLVEVLQDPVYDSLRQKQPNFADFIVPIEGDVAEIRLGIDDKDWLMVTEEVDVIFHMAATTRFDEELRVATLINVRGTREALALGRACKKLRSFVHVSTAYSHACEDRILCDVVDDFYPSPVDPEALIKLVESTETSRLNDATAGLIKNWPNTYSFCKAVAEQLVKDVEEDMPICIVRPAVVIGAYKEPSPGWLDISTVFGASGIILGVGLGLMRVLYAKNSTLIGLIPVDYVNNATICTAWETARRWSEGTKEKKIYPVSPYRNPILWGKIEHYMRTEAPRYATSKTVWYPECVQASNKHIYFLLFWLTQMIPAYFVDGVCFLVGKERRFLKLYKKMYKMTNALGYFTNNHWNFLDQNLVTLYNSLHPLDKDIYNFDVINIDWKEYLCVWCIGLRKYIVKDGLTGTEYGIKKIKMLGILHYGVLALYVYALYKIACIFYCILYYFYSLFY